MIKSNDKVLKELDDLLKEVDELIKQTPIKKSKKTSIKKSTTTSKPETLTTSKPEVASTTPKRCPNGSRKNKKTGLCEKCELSSTTKPTTTKPKSTTKSTKTKLMTKKEEKEIMKKVNAELRKVNKILKPEVKGKLSAEEKEFRAMLRKTKSEQNKKAKKEMVAKSKAEAKAKLEAHKKEAEAEKLRIQRANLRKSKEIDELKSDFTMFRRYVRYLPTPEEATQLTGKALESAKDYLADAEMYYRNAVDTYKKYKKEGLIEKSELDKLMELFEVKYHVDVMNKVKPLLE
jgi:hypothetical protein